MAPATLTGKLRLPESSKANALLLLADLPFELLPVPLEKFLELELILARFAPFVRFPIAVAPVQRTDF